MFRFTIKFLIVSFLFFVPAAFFHFYVEPNISGDIGRLGKIPFGKEYTDSEVGWYNRNIGDSAEVRQISNPDSLCFFKVVTIGDSFSQRGKNGYQYSLSDCLGCAVANFPVSPDNNCLNVYISLLNNGYIKLDQTVIVETVERRYVNFYSELYLLDTYSHCAEIESNDDVQCQRIPFLSSFFAWIRLQVGFDNPLRSFHLSKECFTHERFPSTLYVYDAVSDGDLHWRVVSNEQYQKASSNLENMISLSEERGVNLIVMMATNKYNAYYPWIQGKRLDDPTLDYIPKDNRVYFSHECLRNAIDNGIMDVYNVNDTHWSVVGADIVGKDLCEWMRKSGMAV